jgi:hypothetical protein
MAAMSTSPMAPTRRRAVVLLTVLATVVASWFVAAEPAAADGPGVGAPWIVSVGDSAISGEAGRWAGNTNESYQDVDALGPTAYYDNAAGTAEQIPGCHRSRAAEVFIGNGVNGKNLACSGARTYTQPPGSGDFKPGLDFYSDAQGRKGQARMLQEFAATHNVEAVVVLIGANNYGFADLVQTCLIDWFTSPSWWPNYCQDDSSITSRFTSSAINTNTANIRQGLLNVRQAMFNAGYADSGYRIIVQTYSSPIPRGSGFRYPQTGFTRQSIGGCGFWNADANWANDFVVPTINNSVTNAAAQTGLSNIVVLNNQSALNGRRLCENTVGLLEERGVAAWTSPGAVDKTEWVSQVRTTTVIGSPYQLQEGMHPSYWGQLALRNCLRLAYNGGAVRGGRCTILGTGLNAFGEPRMQLT